MRALALVRLLSAAIAKSGAGRLKLQIADGCLDRGEDHIKPDVDQIYSRQRNYEAAADHDPGIQDVVDNVKHRGVIGEICPGNDDIVRAIHYLRTCPNLGNPIRISLILRL